MPKILTRWKVTPHGPLEQIDVDLLSVEGDMAMPFGHFPRRMTVIGLSGGRTAIWSAIALGEVEMARIEALGRPTFLIVPSDMHRLDARIWKARYPGISVIAPSGARAGVSEVVPVDATDDVLGDPAVRFKTVDGTGGHEAALLVRRPDGLTLIVNDVIGHVRHPHSLSVKLTVWLTGFGISGPRVPWPVKRKIVRDAEALAGQFRSWADEPELKRIIVSHGEPIMVDPAGALRKLADGLAA